MFAVRVSKFRLTIYFIRDLIFCTIKLEGKIMCSEQTLLNERNQDEVMKGFLEFFRSFKLAMLRNCQMSIPFFLSISIMKIMKFSHISIHYSTESTISLLFEMINETIFDFQQL